MHACIHIRPAYASTDNSVSTEASGGCSWFLLILWVEISSAHAAKSMFSFPYLLISSFFLSSLFLQPLFSLSHHMSSSVCLLKQIEIDHLEIPSRVNDTDHLTGRLISFCYPVMQQRLKQLMYTNTPTHTQTNRCSFLCEKTLLLSKY